MRIRTLVLGGLLGLAGALPALAGELIYRPLNPGFGGNPLLEDYLIGTATIQNQFVGSGGGGGGGGGGAPVINFPPINIDLGGVGGGTPPTGGGTPPTGGATGASPGVPRPDAGAFIQQIQ